MSGHAERLHQAKLGTARRIAAQLRGGPPDWAPSPMTLSADEYVDAERFAREQRVLFRETPLVICFSSDLPGPGSFRTFDETGVPIVVVRGRDGAVRAFLNVCPHRGARLFRETAGEARGVSCWFHAWSFTLEGKRIGAPGAEGFAGCLDDRDLIAVPAGERHGLVFVQATPGSAMDLDAFLGDFAPELAMLEIGQAERVKSAPLPVAANWKYALDTYGEGYHFNALHRETLAPYFNADVQVYDRFGRHHRIVWAARDMTRWLDQPESEWGVDHMVGWVHYIFPNTILFTGSTRPDRGYYTTFRHFPGAAPGQTTTYKTIYSPRPIASTEYRAEVAAAFDATAHVVQAEDYVVAAEGWRNLEFVAGRRLVFGRQEVALQDQHRSLSAALGLRDLYQTPAGIGDRAAAE